MSKKLLLLFSLLAISSYSTNSFAKEIKQPPHQAIERIEKDVGIIDIIGEIDDDSADVVHRGFRDFEAHKLPQVIIHLNSLGGKLTPGTEIVTDIEDAEAKGILVVTYVDHQEYCASMCTGIFAVGTDRMSAEDTLWVFHAPYIKLTDKEKKDPIIVKQVNDAILEAQEYMLSLYRIADPAWTDKVLKPHIMTPGDDLIMTGGEILKDNNQFILVKIVD